MPRRATNRNPPPSEPPSGEHVAWLWTYHNYTEEDCEKIKNWKYVKYLVFGKEICPTTGTPHLQGYVEWTSKRQFSVINKLSQKLSNHINWLVARGTGVQNQDYCTKDGDYWEQGKPSHQGSRTDLNSVKEMIDNGATELEIAESHFETWSRFNKSFSRYALLKSKPRNVPPTVVWYWGLTGTGKTFKATESCSSFYIKDGTQWWDMYENEDGIIIDDFDGKWPYRDFLRLLDRYPYKGQVKGGYVNINSPKIYITCEFPPSHFWSGNELAQVLRRLTLVEELKSSFHESTPEVLGNNNPALPEIKNNLEEFLEKTFDNCKKSVTFDLR